MNHLTSVEIYIWNYLEENKAKIIQMTVAQIAESAHVSPSSIIRTLKKKKFSGFSEYKNMEKQKLNRHDWIYGLTKDANQVVSENIEELLMTVRLLESENLAKVVENIFHAASVVIISRGLSVRIADSFARDLQFLDVKAVSLYQDNMQAYLEKLPRNTFVIGLSLSGETDLIVATAQKAKRDGKKVLAITGNYKSRLVEQSDLLLLAYQKNLSGKILVDYNNMFPLELIIHLLIQLYKQYKEYGAIV
ncbi:MurR/RpiR family transcriptional regulator [Lactococcus lactis]|uniref:MurR/RpiR family transcriptional regulator n=1 Tax=Lactococcus lactis TaxID=1358 RepID=UPI0022B90F79|nr:MurR/RpiR family transcriptional regulator [Lactococcus lactis]MCZ8491330.1 MurR/RpiR family transcriptional regulator [Lactococcus lactis]